MREGNRYCGYRMMTSNRWAAICSHHRTRPDVTFSYILAHHTMCMMCSQMARFCPINWWLSSTVQFRTSTQHRHLLQPFIQVHHGYNASSTARLIHDYNCRQDSRESNDERCKPRRLNIICGWTCRSDTGGSFRYSLAHFQRSYYHNVDSLCQMTYIILRK